ncbi:MAG: SDR family oxidoreductase [Deltaproteobacteria bacterium]|nr:SDR family oxidoreductase [Deltaproteobacteria bacterium]
MKSLRNRVAVVTGAGSGIGRGLALELAAEGCTLALVDVNPETLAETAAMVPGASTHVVDVSDRAAMEELPAAVLAAHGRVELLFNNAGIAVHGTFDELTYEDWDRVMGVNLWGVVHGCKAFMPHLEMADEAWIVNISSVFGLVAVPTQSIYCTTKFAVRGFTEVLDEELQGTNIGVSVVHPGAIDTNIVDSPSYDPDTARRSKEFFAQHALDPRTAAKVIVAGVKAKRLRIMVGREAPLIDRLKRLLPVWGNRFIVSRAVKDLGLGGLRSKKLVDREERIAQRRAALTSELTP